MDQTRIYILLRSYFQNNFTRELKSDFQKWYLTTSFIKERDEAMQTIWNEIQEPSTGFTKNELKKLHARIGVNKKNTIPFTRQLLRIAAIILLPISGAVATYFVMRQYPEVVEPELVECFVKHGERKQILLVDGSRVWLNSGSLLIYSKKYEGKQRVVFLNGEGYFKVAKNPNKPFIVKTSRMDIQALGTAFNVQAYYDSKYTISTLNEGVIRTDTKNNAPHSAILKPGEQVILDHLTGQVTKREVKAAKTVSWIQGNLIFEGVAFDEIIKTLERHYAITIRYENGKHDNHRFTMQFGPNEPIGKVLEILSQMVPDLKYHIQDKIIYIK